MAAVDTESPHSVEPATWPELSEWNESLESAEKLIPVLGGLYRNNNVVVTCYGRPLMNKGVIEIVKTVKGAHKFTEDGTSVTISQISDVLHELNVIGPNPSRIDAGKLASKFQHADPAARGTLKEFLTTEIADVVPTALSPRRPLLMKPRDVVLYGFGRIGRLLARILIEKTGAGDKLRLRAVVVRPVRGGKSDLAKRAALLQRDSVHGRFNGVIEVDEERQALICNGNVVRFIHAPQPEDVDYTKYDIDNAIVIDNTGVLRDRKELSRHLESKGASKVILTAPCGASSGVPNIVAGVNDSDIDPSLAVYAAASCTTNAVVPVLSTVHKRFGIDMVHIETVHSFTNDQHLIDNFHPKARRGRAAAINMVITETGAAGAVAQALPDLKGKVTGNAIRVPTPDVSLAILVLTIQTGNVTAAEFNEFLRREATIGEMQQQIDYSASDEIVSSDFVGSKAACIVDSKATLATPVPAAVEGGESTQTRVNLYLWYDNENGYSAQVVRLCQRVGGVVHPRFPQDQ